MQAIMPKFLYIFPQLLGLIRSTILQLFSCWSVALTQSVTAYCLMVLSAVHVITWRCCCCCCWWWWWCLAVIVAVVIVVECALLCRIMSLICWQQLMHLRSTLILWVPDRFGPCSPILVDSILKLMTVWRITGKIIRTTVIVSYIYMHIMVLTILG